jgi:hypothetical protein
MDAAAKPRSALSSESLDLVDRHAKIPLGASSCGLEEEGTEDEVGSWADAEGRAKVERDALVMRDELVRWAGPTTAAGAFGRWVIVEESMLGIHNVAKPSIRSVGKLAICFRPIYHVLMKAHTPLPPSGI